MPIKSSLYVFHQIQPTSPSLLIWRFFRPMKGAWRKILLNYKLMTNTSPVPKTDFPKLLNKLMVKLDKSSTESMVNGFKKAGIQEVTELKY